MDKPETSNAVIWYDFTWRYNEDENQYKEIIEILEEHCKKYCFQLEQGEETGYKHFQGRMKMLTKIRASTLRNSGIFPKCCYLNITSAGGRDNFEYVMKKATRIAGPWMSKDLLRMQAEANPDKPLARELWPRQIKHINTMRPWQQTIIDSGKEENFDARTINILIDTSGNSGKSSLKTYMGVNHLAQTIPYRNDYRDVMRMIMSAPKRPCYIIDLPRALRKEEMRQFISGVESLKDGYAFDDRYTFKQMYFDSPCIWIFTNVVPDLSMLSRDRWKIWEISDDDDVMTQSLEQVKIGSRRYKQLVNKSIKRSDERRFKKTPQDPDSLSLSSGTDSNSDS